MYWLKQILLALCLNACFVACSAQSDTIGIGNGRLDGNFIGGINLYSEDRLPEYQYRLSLKKADHYVNSVGQFLKSLSIVKPGEIIYLNPDSTYNLAYVAPVKLPQGVIIISNRGENGSDGALIFSNKYDTNPLFETDGDDIKIIGLRIKGPDGNVVNEVEVEKILGRFRKNNPGKKPNLNSIQTYGISNSQGIRINHKNVVVENCEIFNWSHAGIYVGNNGLATIKYNYVHHNQRKGLGYGVMVEGYAYIKANIFDYNRHAIAGSGIPGSGYMAEYNIALENSTNQGHIFDMHGGTDRKDGTNIAGDAITIKNNLLYVKENRAAIKIRGVSSSNSVISKNKIVIIDSQQDNDSGRIAQRGSLSTILSDSKRGIDSADLTSLIMQVNGQGNLNVSENYLEQQ